MEQTSAAKFAVNIEGLKIPQEAKEKIAREIEGVILRNIAELDLGNNDKLANTIIRRKERLGIILRRYFENKQWRDVGEIEPVNDIMTHKQLGH